MKKALRIASGIGLVLLGIAGLILPIMPGWIFLIPGLVILGEHYPPIQRLVDWAKEKAEKATGRKFGSDNSRSAPRDSDTESAKMEETP